MEMKRNTAQGILLQPGGGKLSLKFSYLEIKFIVVILFYRYTQYCTLLTKRCTVWSTVTFNTNKGHKS